MHLSEIGILIKDRREELGLSQLRLAAFCNIPPEELRELEFGETNDIGFYRLQSILKMIGLAFDEPNLAARRCKKGLWMAAQTSSISYRNTLAATDLQRFLISGEVHADHQANIIHFLEEAPIELIVMAVEEASKTRSQTWEKLEHYAKKNGISRHGCWE